MTDQQRRWPYVVGRWFARPKKPPTDPAIPALILERWPWRNDDYDVLSDGVVVGCISLSPDAPSGRPWMWKIAYGYRRDRAPTEGFEPTCDAAMLNFAKSWRREESEQAPAVKREAEEDWGR
jgi:hypothetical protein